MRLAIDKARQGLEKGQTPFGACIVRDSEIIACEHNTVWQNTDITAHAEIVTIRAACAKLATVDLGGCVIYSSCEPCPMCFSACHWAKLDTIIYGASIADARNAGFSELDISNQHMKEQGPSPIKIINAFLREEAIALFTLWSEKTDRKTY